MTTVSQKTLAFLLWCFTITTQAQTTIDPKRIAQIDAAIAIEMPTQEQKWLEDQARIDDNDLEFHRDTFRVNYTRCQLVNDLEEDAQMEHLVAIYQYTALRYDQLIGKYDALMRKCTVPALQAAYIQSQESWLAYRKQTLALFSDSPETSDQAIQHLTINKHRLAEIYFFYSEWDFEGLIKND